MKRVRAGGCAGRAGSHPPGGGETDGNWVCATTHWSPVATGPRPNIPTRHTAASCFQSKPMRKKKQKLPFPPPPTLQSSSPATRAWETRPSPGYLLPRPPASQDGGKQTQSTPKATNQKFRCSSRGRRTANPAHHIADDQGSKFPLESRPTPPRATPPPQTSQR